MLREIGGDVEKNTLVPFPRLQTLHFARWVLLRASHDAGGRPTPASLVFSTNFDEPVEAHLDELYEHAREGLHRIYSHCVGFPPPDRRTNESVLGYLREREIGYNTLYVGTRGLTTPRIRDEARLRDALEGFLDQATRRPEVLQQDPATIRAEIQEFVRSQPELDWATEPGPRPRRLWPIARDVPIVAGVAAVILVPFVVGLLSTASVGLALFGGIVGALVVAVGLWAVVLRRHERSDAQFPPATDFAHVATLAQNEDRFVQNQMSAVNNLKPGRFRLFTLRTVLRVIDLAGRYVFTRGRLGTIPSIHFARWVIIDNGRRVLFLSNFDGSWENYLGDFVDKAADGLTAVWSNTEGFPASRWLVKDGATDEQRFKARARNSQIVTQVWYSAYKTLSVQNINNNAQIRAGLFAPQSAAETAAWLQRL
ncbi:MAG: hypothetical protein ACRD26_08760 [Vicinamibacterales bacterium]